MKKKNDSIVMTGLTDGDYNDFSGGEPMLWLQYGCKPQATADKVGANVDSKDIIYHPSYWPKHVVVKSITFQEFQEFGDFVIHISKQQE
ncbi:hypothetical protein JTB14_036563 [Gonioctena quinquepunctata]|nr:hypothetical protein JTB14_036563 [Gonioctena quinquepunctata]